MKFKGKRFITSGIDSEVNPLLQIFMWHCIDTMPPPKDYLQVFKCNNQDGKQKIEHYQEEPDYKKEYLFKADAPVFVGKIFVIDSGDYCAMLLASEY